MNVKRSDFLPQNAQNTSLSSFDSSSQIVL